MKFGNRFKDLSGREFGFLKVKVPDGRNYKKGIVWKCLCVCGKIHRVSSGDLISGHTKSCGCQISRAVAIARTTHGLSSSVEHGVWSGMKKRCAYPKTNGYKHYGGRGIKVCNRWVDSFAIFYADMGPRPTSKHTIERINNDGNYEPTNCKWATRKEQAANKRKKRHE